MKGYLEDVVKDRLSDALNYSGEEEGTKAAKEAAELLKYYVELEKLEISEGEADEKLRLEKEKFEHEKKVFEENKKLEEEKRALQLKEAKGLRVFKVLEIAVPVALFIGDCAFKMHYAKKICNFEKDYTFTTSAGKGISSIFRFKK